MRDSDKVNILLVDDQPAKLLSYEVILSDLGENLIKARSASEALECLLKTEIAVVLMDVSMPELDGFELAAMIRQHPRYQKTAIILISAVFMTDLDRLKGYDSGAMDYIPVPVVPEILRAKVAVFVDLYRKTRQLEWLNRELEQRVAERTAELEASMGRLRDSEERYRHLIHALPAAIYTCDAQGHITLYNETAVALWGREPELGKDLWCGSRRLYTPDGARLPFDQCPMAIAVRDGRPVRGQEIIVECPDGTRRYVLPYPDPIRDASGAVIGAVNMLVDLTERRQAEQRTARLQAVAAALSAALTPAQVYEIILREGASILNAKAGVLNVVSQDGQWLEPARRMVNGAATAQEDTRFPLTAPSPAAEAARTGEAVWLESAQALGARYPQAAHEHASTGYEASVSLPLWFEKRALGSLQLSFATARDFNRDEREFLLTLARLCAQALERARLYQEAQQLNAELEQRVMKRAEQLRRAAAERDELRRRLMDSRETERVLLAQELHDGPIQELHAVSYRLVDVQNKLNDDVIQAPLAAGQELLQRVIKTLRSISGELRPPTLTPFGLSAAIRSHADDFQAKHPDLEIHLDVASDKQLLPERVRLALFRIYQHALINVVRHAEARRVVVRWQVAPE